MCSSGMLNGFLKGDMANNRGDDKNEAEGRERDRLLINLLKTPPQPRPKKEREESVKGKHKGPPQNSKRES